MWGYSKVCAIRCEDDSGETPAYFDVLVGSVDESNVGAVVTGIHNVEMIFPGD
jgi:hypothetical protein